MAKIGVVGHLGCVGAACLESLFRAGFDVVGHDLQADTKLDDLLQCEAVYVCVPTPSRSDGSCETGFVEEVVANLMEFGFSGFIVIKSTISPGTTEELIKKYRTSRIGFSPELLKERSSLYDYQNQPVLVVGTENIELFELVKKHHLMFTKNFVRLKPAQAEIFKYFSNCLNATLITLANSFAMVAEYCGVDYTEIKETLLKRGDIGPNYLDSNPNLRGWQGQCLPKEMAEMDSFCKRNGLDVEFFNAVQKENNRYPKTVFPGMRSE